MSLAQCWTEDRVPWWTKELTTLRKDANKAFHYAFHTKSEDDWDNHRAVRRLFKKFLRRAKRESWQLFCHEIEGVNESARLNKILILVQVRPALLGC
jgi:hypothetical protein